jgi:superfamily II DNA or RNA helicase/HKD family nuclease
MAQRLVTGGTRDPFLPRLLAAIRQANKIDLAVAFIKQSGLDLLFGALSDAIELRDARLRVLTSDYLDVTDPQALRRLLLLAERGAEVRLFEAGHHSFHLKAYICVRTDQGHALWGSAFIGSSNISRTALTDGLEWNVQVDHPEEPTDPAAQHFQEIRDEFQHLFDHGNTRDLDHDWIDIYDARRRVQRLPIPRIWDEPEEPAPEPTPVQAEALVALEATRAQGFRRGLVVMATGLGKTYLAAFDSAAMGAKRVLFVAHREEILLQAESSFQRVRPGARVGRYNASRKDANADLIFASIQTLGRDEHLAQFAPGRFDYVVVDEFHHAAAPTYRGLLAHFRPRFLLGLTATPERTDQSDLLSLCDDNLVYTRNLFDGVELGHLSPLSYYGIHDETVDYREIPWRNGRFDPDALEARLATLARARHALRHWRAKAQQCTLAFCVSTAHADFMAARFSQEGISSAAVYRRSTLDRGDALDRLARGDLQVLFSVDLFNEGVDLPAIDTVMMLRPTESKILFLQQLGRGLRRHPGKERLVVLDFIGNHKGFLNKPDALFDCGKRYRDLADFARRARDGSLALPPGCFANYDLAIIDFLIRLKGSDLTADYEALKESQGRRPTLAELYRSGARLAELRRRGTHWWELVRDQGDLEPAEAQCLERHGGFFRELETTAMTKSFKAILLESFLELDGLRNPPRIEALAAQALEVFRRRRGFIGDIAADYRDIDTIAPAKWLRYWRGNPIRAWLGENRKGAERVWFELREGQFAPTFEVTDAEHATFAQMVQELVDYRLAAYETRTAPAAESSEPEPRTTEPTATIIPLHRPAAPADDWERIPYFPDLRIACGHFRAGRTDAETRCSVAPGHGRLDPQRHFVARAIGNSMDGGKHPVRDGDYLLLELMDPQSAGSITGHTVAIERQDSGDDQYLLRTVTKTPDGRYILKAANPDYPDYEAGDEMRTLARLKGVLDSDEIQISEPTG